MLKKFSKIILKSLAWLFAGLVVLFVLLMAFGVRVDLSFLRSGVELAANTALQRKVSLAGPIALEFSGWPALSVSDIRVSDLPGSGSDDFLQLGFARFQLGLLPLLKGELLIADMTATDVKINLRSDTQGQGNWVLGDERPAQKVPQPEQQPAPEVQGDKIQLVGLDQFLLKNVTINYIDEALGERFSLGLEQMELTAAQGQPILLSLNGRVEETRNTPAGKYQMELQGDTIEMLLDKQRPWAFEAQGVLFDKHLQGKGGFDLSGELPQVAFALSAQELDVGVILSRLGLVEGLQASLGDAAMDVTLRGGSLNEILQQSSMAFLVKEGRWTIEDPYSDASFNIEKLNGKISVDRGNNLNMALQGTIRDIPVELEITGAPLVDYVRQQKEVPLNIEIDMLQSQLSFSANVKLPLSDPNMTFELEFSSESLDRLEPLFDLDFPPWGPISLTSRLDVRNKGYDLSALTLQSGASQLSGNMQLDMSGEQPDLRIELVSKLIQLDDFSGMKTPQQEPLRIPETGEDAEQPRDLLSYDILRALNAEITIQAQQVLSGEDKLGSGLLNIGLQDAQLQLKPLQLNVPGGNVEINLSYAARQDERVDFDVQAEIDKFDLGNIIRRLKPGTDMGGVFRLDLDIQSSSPDGSSFMKYANGHLDFGLVPRNFASGVVDLWAVNLLSAVMEKSTEKDKSTINCLVVRLDVEDGLLSEDALYLDTTKMRIAGKVDIDFKTRDLEIKLAPKAKRPEFFSVAVPIKVKGKLDDFGLKINALRMAGQVLSFITSPVHVPIRRVVTIEEPSDGVEACKLAWNRTIDESVSEQDKPGKQWY